MFFRSLKGLAVILTTVWLAFVFPLYYWTGGKTQLHRTWWLYVGSAVAFILIFVSEAVQVWHNEKIDRQTESITTGKGAGG